MQVHLAPLLFFPAVSSSLLAMPAHRQDLPPEIHGALRDWRARYGENWQLVFNRVSNSGRMLFGGGAAPPFLPETEAERQLLGRYFVMEASRLLGVDHETLQPAGTIELPLAAVGTTDKLNVRFRQQIQGVPVQDGWVDVLFEKETGNLLSIDSQAIPDAAFPSITPTTSAETARRIVVREFAVEIGARTTVTRPPRLVILARDDGAALVPTLAWEIEITGDPADGVRAARSYLVAALGPTVILARTDLIHEAVPRQQRTGGIVTANVTEDGCCFGWDDGSNHVTRPMADLKVTFSDGSTTTTDASGFFSSPTGASGEESVTLSFRGPFVVVSNHVHWPEGDLLVRKDLGTDLTILPLNPFPQERDIAQANAFFRVGQMRNWVRAANPNDAVMESSSETPGVPYHVVVNWVIPRGEPGGGDGIAPCNALFDAHAGLIKLSVSGQEFGLNCPNGSFAPILWHEMGHWLNQRYGSGNDRMGFGEGSADVYAMYQMDRPVLAYGSVMRSGENTATFCGDCESDQGCLGAPHRNGLPLMGPCGKRAATWRRSSDPRGVRPWPTPCSSAG